MSATKHTLTLLLSVLLAYVWLTTPALSTYSLQIFAISSFGYFVIKKINNGKLWHLLPKNHSLEMMFVTFSVLLLVGATGNAASVFYPFVYIHLFILVMSCREKTAIIITMAEVLFHYALDPSMSSGEIATIITIPIMLLFFLFAKRQYDDAQLSHTIIEKEESEIKTLTNQEHTLESFIITFLKPKLAALEELLSDDETTSSVQNQISLISSESDKILEKININDTKN